jgi:hypothetical protein
MWTNENRGRYDRSELRYTSDLTDEEWAIIAPVIPPAKRGGGKRTVRIRDMINGLMYVLSSGCQWRAITKDLPPRSRGNGWRPKRSARAGGADDQGMGNSGGGLGVGTGRNAAQEMAARCVEAILTVLRRRAHPLRGGNAQGGNGRAAP